MLYIHNDGSYSSTFDDIANTGLVSMNREVVAEIVATDGAIQIKNKTKVPLYPILSIMAWVQEIKS